MAFSLKSLPTHELDQVLSILPALELLPSNVHTAVEVEQLRCRQNGSNLIQVVYSLLDLISNQGDGVAVRTDNTGLNLEIARPIMIAPLMAHRIDNLEQRLMG